MFHSMNQHHSQAIAGQTPDQEEDQHESLLSMGFNAKIKHVFLDIICYFLIYILSYINQELQLEYLFVEDLKIRLCGSSVVIVL